MGALIASHNDNAAASAAKSGAVAAMSDLRPLGHHEQLSMSPFGRKHRYLGTHEERDAEWYRGPVVGRRQTHSNRHLHAVVGYYMPCILNLTGTMQSPRPRCRLLTPSFMLRPLSRLSMSDNALGGSLYASSGRREKPGTPCRSCKPHTAQEQRYAGVRPRTCSELSYQSAEGLDRAGSRCKRPSRRAVRKKVQSQVLEFTQQNA